MKQYLDFLKYVVDNGVEKGDRTGTGTKSIFSYEMRFDLKKGFPLLTTKKLHLKSIIHELLWFLSGDTNIKYLNDNGVRIWDEWADENGNLGPVYGSQWRNWRGDYVDSYYMIDDMPYPDGYYNGIDQISMLIDGLKNNPDSRRHIVSSWNPAEIPEMALPPCHCFFQCYVVNNRLSLKLTQRSADIFLGVPFNIASYSLLLHMLAQQCDMEVGEFIWSGGDCHAYINHLDQIHEQLNRTPKELPKLEIIRKPDSIFEYTFDDFKFMDYDPYPNIKAQVAV